MLRRNRVLGWAVSISLALLATVACITAYVAIVQKKTAQSRELAARASANLVNDPEQSLHYAMESAKVSPTSEAVSAMCESLIQSSLRAVLKSQFGSIITADFSSDGAHIITGVRSSNGLCSLQLWDVLTGKPVCIIKGARGGRFTADGLQIRMNDGRIYDVLSCKTQGEISLIDTATDATGEQNTCMSEIDAAHQEYKGWTQEVFRNSSGTMELAYQDNIPVIREVNTAKVLRTLRIPPDPIGGAVFSEKNSIGGLLVTWARKNVYMESGGGPTELGEKVLRLWSVENDETDRILSGHRRAINGAAFGPDNEIIVTGSDDRTARVWLTYSGEEFAMLRGHTQPVDHVAISPDGSYVLTLSEDGTARIWEPGTILPMKIGMTDLFALQYGMLLPNLQGDGVPIQTPKLSADRRTILAEVDNSHINIWDALTGRQKGVLEGSSKEYGDLHGWPSPDGTQAVTVTGELRTAAGGEVARVWDIKTGQVIAELRGHDSPVYAAAYSPEGRHIVTVGEDGTARLWNATTFDQIHELRVSDGRVVHAAFSNDSARLATASRDSLVRIWDVQSGQSLLELRGHEGGVLHASFSPDDKLIISDGEDGTRIWDSRTGNMLGRYMGFDDLTVPFITTDCAKLVTGVYGDEKLKRVHTFGACGTVDQLLSVARSRVIHESSSKNLPAH